jgi:uncharacterized membrane protein
MASTIKWLHRFMVSQALYPLIISTLLALGMYAARVVVGRSWNYNNLLWNLALAWIPYIASIIAYAFFRVHPKSWWLLIIPGFIWLIFFPNAPYIVTDFLHLQKRPYIPLWYDIALLATFAWTGIFLGIVSLRTMQFIVKEKVGVFLSWVFALTAMALSGFGIYLGRFGRWNSWDLLVNPFQVLGDTLSRITSLFSLLHIAAFTLMFTGFLLATYLMYTWVTNLEGREESRPGSTSG